MSNDSTDADAERPRVALIGPPNVGKSVLFNALTGLDAGVANYSGTTVEYKRGSARFRDHETTLVDVPGTYSLAATNEAEQLAVDMLEGECDLVICVLDAVNLENSLHLLLEVLEYDIPVVVAINRVDLLEKEGKRLRPNYLASALGLPVVPTIATIGKGFDDLVAATAATLADSSHAGPRQHVAGAGLAEESDGDENPTAGEEPDGVREAETIPPLESRVDDGPSWERAGELCTEVVVEDDEPTAHEPGYLERWSDHLVKPWPGLPVAGLVLVGTFALVVGVGMGIRQYLMIPFFEGLVFPQIESAVQAVTAPGFYRDVLIGDYGFLIKGLEWPFALVLPYVVSFYFALSLLEDSGYLPRLAVLLDGLFERMGLAGSNVVPLLLGYGCAIPGITATRATSNSEKQRLTMMLMITLAVPCVAQTGAFIALLAEATVLLVVAVFVVSFAALGLAGLVLDATLEGTRQPTVADVPPLLMPPVRQTYRKVWMRLKQFVSGGALHMVYAIGFASVLYELGVLEVASQYLEPLVVGWLNLPAEASTPLILGIVRRELTVLPLLEMDLAMGQLFVGAVVGLFYVPCIAVFATVAQEFSLRAAGLVLVMTMAVSFFVGGLFAQLFVVF
ncbi:ferrous iron transporter B [Natronobacterium gregoryi]|uniref:Ferrous iron transporter B n=2 Tax=Natronobacterium gregoryi TaxID=44930 RepID=L0AEQ0_NATGS|nr:ferrous iron transporter B [Natronobacterium gregoryi]AFZ71592.1 small GTP-binding protein domain protein [Natronobacterium gregoryi SP2]ELY66647.1 small GTP-binding protein [Natronobacterium gregoryi SP2]PLK21359.1 ferrous iron transporter B [Natronobacterium gregoryi SP2]SFI80969.1 ferrous iron transport protein B [Natronobacterium gregoryi]